MQTPSLFWGFLHEATAEDKMKVNDWKDLKTSVEPLNSVVVSMMASVLLAGVVVDGAVI